MPNRHRLRAPFGVAFLVGLVLLVSSGGTALAQVTVPGLPSEQDTQAVIELTEPLTQEAANALVARLNESEVRALLLAQLELKASADAVPAGQGLSEFSYHATVGALENVFTTVRSLPTLITGQTGVVTNFYATLGAAGLLHFVVLVGLTLALALGVELGFRRLSAPWTTLPPMPEEARSIRAKLVLLLKRLASELGAVAVFVSAAYLIGRLLLPPAFQPVASLIELYLIGVPRLFMALARFFLAPNNPAYRIVRATDAHAKTMVFHLFWFGLLVGGSIAVLDFNELGGVMRGELRLGFWILFMACIYIVLVFWRYRDAMADMMRGYDPDISPLEERIARAYPYFGIIVTVAIWWVVNIIGSYGNFAFLATVPHYKTLALALLAPGMDTAIRSLVRHLVPPMSGEGEVAERAHQSARRSFIRIGRVIVFGVVLIMIARIWGMTPTTIASAGVGPRLAASAIEFLFILSIGYLLYELVSLLINRKLAAEITASGYDPDNADFGGDGGGTGGSRLSTVLPLILLISRSVIVVLFVLLALSHIGLDTTPLLAGAGIVGLAIGFGAQKLVMDVVSGVFFLIDDAFRRGEYVDIEGTMGTVEKISIRSLQLRHHRGSVYTIPYGEIPKINNFSRDWVIMKLRFTVPFGTDPNRVKKIFKRIGQEMLEHPELRDDFLQPFKSQGVLEIDDVGIVIRGKFMAKPGKQFMIRKEVFNRVNAAFAEEGIHFARREVRVAIPGLEQSDTLSADEKATIAAAAAEAVQEDGNAPEKKEEHGR